MRLDAFFLADHSQVAEGKVYVNGGGISRLNVPTIPFAIPLLSIVVRYLVEGSEDFGEHTFGLRLETPSGVNLLPDEPVGSAVIERNRLAVDGEEQSMQLSLNFGGVPILEEGVHVLTVELDGEVSRRMTLPVVVIDDSPATPRPNRAGRRRQQRAS